MDRIEEIKRRHKERRERYRNKREATRNNGNGPSSGPTKPTSGKNNTPGSSDHFPIFRAQTFIIKCLFAAAIVLLCGLLYKSNGDYSEAKAMVNNTLTHELNFAKVSAWYEDAFGQPLSFFPTDKEPSDVASEDSGSENYTMPVNGTVTKGFSTTSKGIYVKTESDAEVEAIESGFVVSVDDKENIGKTVVIQHSDGSESWYGMLKSIDVKPYELVDEGQKLGVVSTESGSENGSFYFALKEGDHFVDPIQVIKFE